MTQNHYIEKKLISYLSSLIYFESINFDKKQKKYSYRHDFILDKPLDNDSNIIVRDKIEDETARINLDDMLTFEQNIESSKLYSAFQKLTPKQEKILKLSIIDGLKDTEIANEIGISQQAVTKHKHKAIQQLKITVLS